MNTRANTGATSSADIGDPTGTSAPSEHAERHAPSPFPLGLQQTDHLQRAGKWKERMHWTGEGYYTLQTEDTGDVPVRLFLTPALLEELEEQVYPQLVNATQFPGVQLVVLTPDVHVGYGVPVGSVILTHGEHGALAMGPVGFDIGCGMMSARSEVPADLAPYEKRLAFNRAVMERVDLGVGGHRKQHRIGQVHCEEFERLVRGGAEYYVATYGATFDRSHAERHRIPVDDDWQIPWGGKGRPERGIPELGSLGGGNHFIELQRCVQTGTLFVQVHTGSRAFGHGLATNYFELARAAHPEIPHLDLGYFVPGNAHYRDYMNAVAAGGNYAILNRLMIYEEVAVAFRQVFGGDLELIYEISHNLVQREWHPDFGEVWVHRKGATRAFPAGHPALVGTPWEQTGHPVLIPGSNKDTSYVLRPLPGAVKSAFSVNHGAGRRMSRSEAVRTLSQHQINAEYRAAGIPINLEAPVPIDEAAPCYKPAHEVVAAVVSARLARVEYELLPLASLKGTETRRVRRRRARGQARHQEGSVVP